MPLTIRIPYGGGIGAVEHHSESPEAYFTHTAGLRVVTPSSAGDVHRTTGQAIVCDDPVVFFEPKRRYWEKGEVDEAAPLSAVPLERARIVSEGTDVTVAAYGPMVATVLEASRIGAAEGTSLEVIDLRSLTGRLRHDRSVCLQDGPPGRRPRGARVLRPRGGDRRPRLRALLLPPRVPGATGRRFRHAVPGLQDGAALPPRRRSHPPRGGPVPADGMSGVRQFRLPDLGEGLTEAEIVTWRVTPGDEVALNQVVVDVETEKAVVELPSPYAGRVVEVLAREGETVAVGAPIIAIDISAAGEEAREKVPTLVGYGPSETPPSRRRGSGRRHPERRPVPSASTGSRPLAAPPVRFMARQNGIDLADVTGHGPGGVITREDLAAHVAGVAVAAQPGEGPGRESRTPVRGIQKHMAAAMVRSVATAPQACVFLTLDVTPTVDLVERLRANRHFDGVRITPLAVVARAMVLALRDAPALNSCWDEATSEVVTKHYVHLGVAVAGPRGLLVPNVKDAQGMTLRELTVALAELAARARDRALHAGGAERRHHHPDQRRRVRRRRRRADTQSRGGRHPRSRRRAATALGVRGRGRPA